MLVLNDFTDLYGVVASRRYGAMAPRHQGGWCHDTVSWRAASRRAVSRQVMSRQMASRWSALCWTAKKVTQEKLHTFSRM